MLFKGSFVLISAKVGFLHWKTMFQGCIEEISMSQFDFWLVHLYAINYRHGI